jgi:DNA-binding CsgD family transcriptional regulator
VIHLVGKPRTFDAVLYLSDAEHQVFALLGEGHAPNDIAEKRGRCSVKTIEAHFAHIKLKLRLPTLAQVRSLAAMYVYHCELFGVQRVEVSPIRPKKNFAFAVSPKTV